MFSSCEFILGIFLHRVLVRPAQWRGIPHSSCGCVRVHLVIFGEVFLKHTCVRAAESEREAARSPALFLIAFVTCWNKEPGRLVDRLHKLCSYLQDGTNSK